MSQKVIATSDLIKWCDEQVAQGKELGIKWEGGGDSGWAYFTIDGQQVSDNAENDEIRQLTDLMYDHLDYGSWAGEFSASGEAIYNSTEKAFVGTDYYSEDENYDFEYPIKITVPESLWFNALEYNIEGETPHIDVAFIVNNGFLTDEHTKVAQEVKKQLEEQVEKAIQAYSQMEDTTEYRSIWQADRFERSSFKLVDDTLVVMMEEISIGTCDTDVKEIYLELTTKEDEY